MPDLLLELFSEEIPARMQTRAAEDLKRLVTDGLVEAGLTYASAGAFSTPRRLTLAVEALTLESRPVREERKGPRADAPDAALQGFLRSTGLAKDQLELRDAGKGKIWFAVIEKPGRPASVIVAEVVEAAIRTFPWPKSMRWGTGSLRWVRPLQSILCLLSDDSGAEVVPLIVDHLTAGNTTEGHRFMAPGRFAVTGFEDYRTKLRRACVVLDAEERRAMIETDARTLAFARGLEMVPDEGLLAEVAGLVEWPVALMGDIDPAFLDLPAEVLQTSMRTHQKFFSVRNPKTARIEGFVTVANRETADEGATILAGNLKVLSARLSDAMFFWENDLRTIASVGLEGMGAGLASVTFHNKLGSQADRVSRIAALAREIAPIVGADPDLAEQAAKVAKADLQSAMVGEFPELQGTMGGYYARARGLPDAVAASCKAHYAPLGPSDAVPTEPVSVAVALADKIDMLTGFWAIDEKPTGSKDPFALRRAALGVVRLVVGNEIRGNIIKFCSYAHLALFIGVMRSFDKENPLLEFYSPEEGDKKPDHIWLQQPVKGFFDYDQLISKGAEKIDGGLTRFGWLDFDVESHREFYEAALPVFKEFEQRVESAESFVSVLGFLKSPHEKPEYPTELGAVITENYRPEVWSTASDNVARSLLAFLHDRLKVHLRDEGIRHDVIDACLAMPGNDDLTLLVHRARALSAFLKTDDGTNLLQGFRRANNILTQAEAKDGVEYSYGADPKFSETAAERALFAALDAAEAAIAPAMAAEDFAAAMASLADLRAPIDAFFEAVQVNADNAVLRRNRLNLLHRIRAACAPVADLSRIEG